MSATLCTKECIECHTHTIRIRLRAGSSVRKTDKRRTLDSARTLTLPYRAGQAVLKDAWTRLRRSLDRLQ